MAAQDFHFFLGRKAGVEQIISFDALMEITVFHLAVAAMPQHAGRIYLYGQLPHRFFGFELPPNPDISRVGEALAWYSNTYYQGMIEILVAMPPALVN